MKSVFLKLGVLTICASCSAFCVAEEVTIVDILGESNRDTSFNKLMEAKVLNDIPEIDSAEFDSYMEANQDNMNLLIEAVKLPPVDFSNFELSRDSSLALLPFMSGLRTHAKFLIANCYYNDKIGDAQAKAEALNTALAFTNSFSESPLLIVQLVKIACVSIICDRFNLYSDDVLYDHSAENTFIQLSDLSQAELTQIIEQIEHVRDSFCIQFKTSLDYEATLSKSQAEVETINRTSALLNTPFDSAWVKLIAEYNENNKTSVVSTSPYRLKMLYNKTIADLGSLQLICEALLYYKSNGELPLYREQFFPMNFLNREDIRFDYYLNRKDAFTITSDSTIPYLYKIK